MDKGGEYISKAFLAFLREHGIVVRMTVRNRPQQNGVAERANRTIEEHTTSMLEQAGLPDSFRGEAVGAYVHVRNMIPTAANPRLRLLNSGTRRSLKFLTCAFGDAMPMCMCRRISGLAFILTLNDASSLVILQIMLDGNSTTQ